jgi:competence protein ComEC
LVATFPWFIAGLWAPVSLSFVWWVLVGALVAHRFWGLCLIAMGLGVLRGFWVPVEPEPLPAGEYTLRGYVRSTPVLRKGSQSFILDIGDRRLLVNTTGHRFLAPGDLVEVQGVVKRIATYTEDKGFDRRAYWGWRGVWQEVSTAYVGGVSVLEPGWGIGVWGAEWRDRMWKRLRRHLPDDSAGLVMGVIAGQGTLVDKETYEAMSRAGTLHLLSTSGFHVLLLAGLVGGLLRLLPVPRPLQIGVIFLVLSFYSAGVGGRPPIVRASLMAGAFLSAYLFNRIPDGLSALALAAYIVLFLEPGAIFDAGFQLSFIVTTALVMYMPWVYSWMKRFVEEKVQNRAVGWVLLSVGASLATTVVAQLASAPILAHHFGQVSLIAPIANLLSAVVVPLIYVGSLAAQVAEVFSEALSQGLDLAITGSFVGWMQGVNGYLGNLSWSAVTFSPAPGWVAWMGCALVVFLGPRPGIPPWELERRG